LNRHFFLLFFFIVFKADIENLAMASTNHAFFVSLIHRNGCDNASKLGLGNFFRILWGQYGWVNARRDVVAAYITCVICNNNVVLTNTDISDLHLWLIDKSFTAAFKETFNFFVESTHSSIAASQYQSVTLVCCSQEIRLLQVLCRHFHDAKVYFSVREIFLDLIVRVTLVVELDLPKSQVALGAYSRPPNNAIVFDVLLYDNFVCRMRALVLGSD
jgi:hypothetical protein